METARNKKDHAEIFFNHLWGDNVEITAEYPAGRIGNRQRTFWLRPRGRSWNGALSTQDLRKSRGKRDLGG
jgi:hypothetical protein